MKKMSFIQRMLYLVGQVVLIFLGVTVAIWFENINEARKEKKFEQVLLSEMLFNLNNDIRSIDEGVRIINDGIYAGEKIVEALKKNDFDSIPYYMTTIMWYNIGLYNSSSYETIKSKGLDIIQDNSLRQKIVQYYEERVKYLKEVEKVGYNLTWQQYMPQAISKFRDFSLLTGTQPLDINALKNDNEFKQVILITIELKKFERRQHVVLRESAVLLTDAIKAHAE